MRRLDDTILPYAVYENPNYGLSPHFTWRRSAAEFAQELLARGMTDPSLVARGIDPAQHASVLQALAQEAARFDAVLRERLSADEVWTPKPPKGLRKKHWWWWRGTCVDVNNRGEPWYPP